MQLLWKKITDILLLTRIKKRWQKFATVLAIVVVFSTTYMLVLPAITMEKKTYCGFSEHTHSDVCYMTEETLVCGMKETIEKEITDEVTASAMTNTQETTAEETSAEETTETKMQAEKNIDEATAEETTTRAQQGHTHTSQCYEYKSILICTDTEHTHIESCFIEELSMAAEDAYFEKVTDGNLHEHIHSLKCYTAEGTLICTEWGNESPWSLDWESGEFRDKAVKYVTYLINQLPTVEDFEEKLNRYDLAEDYDGYENYFMEVEAIASRAWVNYENLPLDLRQEVTNSELVIEYRAYFERTTFASTDSKTIKFLNYYDEKTAGETVLIHSNSVGDISGFRFYWWYAVVVEENEYGALIVTEKYYTDLADKSNLEPATARGFVLLTHTGSLKCNIGDEATVNFDYLNTNAGYSSGAYGTVSFGEYVPPVSTEEDYVLEAIDEPSDTQIIDAGGTVTAADRDVVVSKKIDGTDIENVFDITLTVQTKTEVQTFIDEPDMAVVIVMDISNTMNSVFSGDTVSRYDAAVTAASSFISQFAENTDGLSKIGFVAFNTSAHEIFSLQPCSTDAQASKLISEMSADTYSIIKANGYDDSYTRFTNVEGGLKRAYDMLKSSGNSNQYVILLTDGFPTTYLVDNSSTSSNYNGYNPYTPSGTPGKDGVFYDYVNSVHCDYGTSYSDKASIRAREMATYIKSQGAKIFSVGVDVAGQKIQTYVDATKGYSYSIVDRTSTTYEIGSANDLNAYKNWLGNSVGSGYYYDSTDREGIYVAFNTIFDEIRKLNEQSTTTIWTSQDPLPVMDENAKTVEFIYFFDKNGNPSVSPFELTGDHFEGYENTASCMDDIIYWNLKKSGYTTSQNNGVTFYYYSVTYRVRLQNELDPFSESEDGSAKIYDTNGDAFLSYRTIVTTNGVQEISEAKTVYFPKPSVKGYLCDFSFTKVNALGETLSGAEFSLVHDTEKCNICRGNGTTVSEVTKYVEVSNTDGKVAFDSIPSGHDYYLDETLVPDGYSKGKSTYTVKACYDVLTVYENIPNSDGTTTVKQWTGINDKIINVTGYVLPETGGCGTGYLYIIGWVLIALSIALHKKKAVKQCRKRLKKI